MEYKLLYGDCIEQMQSLPDNSVDAIVTDPPYGLSKEPDIAEVMTHWLNGDDYTHKGGGFMGKTWDSFVPGPSVWREALRVLKPGGHMLSFFGTRMYDIGAIAIRLAGFEIRDQIMWVYGSGFPKSHNVGKAVNKLQGNERKISGKNPAYRPNEYTWNQGGGKTPMRPKYITKGQSEWEGFGTALKPAHENIVLARKPLSEPTIAKNVLKWGTGALNIDGCRVGSREKQQFTGKNDGSVNAYGDYHYDKSDKPLPEGRFPANLIHDGSQQVLELFPETGKAGNKRDMNKNLNYDASSYRLSNNKNPAIPNDNGGSAARFFYCAKASKRDRDEGCDGLPDKEQIGTYAQDEWSRQNMGNTPDAKRNPRKNTHPTVKPTDLVRYLCRLITPPGGVVLDPFTGSGSTGKAAALEGFDFIGCEMEQEYIDIARARIEHAVHDS